MSNDQTNAVTRLACSFAIDLSFDKVPADVRDQMKLHILDAIGSGIAGAGTSLGEQLVALTALEHAPGPVPILGIGRTLGPAAAAFANAGAMNALDCDDGFEIAGRGMGHPGASIVAAAVSGAFGPRTISGSRFLTVVTASYEINNRLIFSMQPTIERFRFVYGVCQHQSFASAVAYGLLDGASADELENIVGLAGTLANVPSLRKYNFEDRPIVSLKDFNAPAAESGVRAVQMHRVGLSGAKAVLDGPAGLWRMLGSDQFEPAVIAQGLGDTWLARRSSLKAYPACRWIHTCLEAFQTTYEKHGLTPDEIEKIRVFTSRGIVTDFMDVAPRTMVDAQFSLPYALAALAYRLTPFSSWFTSEAMRSPRNLAFATKVEAVVDPQIDSLMRNERRPVGRVEIAARGTTFASPQFDYALGSPERPLSDQMVRSKFLANVVPVVGNATAAELCERLMSIENEEDVRRLIALASGSGDHR
ncbi:MmgE/PrpD family protein [Rhizobium sp. AU243]|uniref:MmgE/PrpD family protein n=1 Tax=Rhizobium sp. AU243 TaxID=2303425 RepID=UPI0010CB6394|nr:MmgE/PrpD family protein [Rhizobium sp. AU243]TKV70770.1 MmgE/PrpD family protein [Rhizobium sp. AU243]